MLSLLVLNLGILYDGKSYERAVDEAYRLHYSGDYSKLYQLYEATNRLISEDSKVEIVF